MDKITILWADDEIDLLKPQLLFLKQKGYEVSSVSNGQDAIEKCQKNDYDVIFLDEQMPGLSGIETLSKIKEIKPSIPVIMITKSEEENLMDDAIGSKISDYLIKPVNPNQILLSIKKIFDNKRLITEKSTLDYQKEFQNITLAINETLNHEDWAEVYKKLIYWELELEKSEDNSISEILNMQKSEANNGFNKFINNNYIDLLDQSVSGEIIMSHNLLKKKVFPLLQDDSPIFFILIDNLRYDQWKAIQKIINSYLKLEEENSFYSILPSTTQYSRNAIFAGLLPDEIEQSYPDLWKYDDEEGSKNLHEEEFLKMQLKQLQIPIKVSYHKITNTKQGKMLVDNTINLFNNDLNVIVYNFVDMLSHARTEIEIIKELANDEAAYRALTVSWFEHSPLLEMIKKIMDKKARVIFTTDHGTIRVKKAVKVIGDRNSSTNLRYKHGKNLQYDPKDVFEVKDPQKAHLPKPNVSSSYIFATEETFFVYPNDYNHYVNFYNNTFQHGGISLEEMILPFAVYSTN